MVDKKTSEETPAVGVADADYWRGVKNGSNVRFSFAMVRTWIGTWANRSTVGLANVDNTSDVEKNAAVGTLTNKTINAALNAISNLTTAMFGPNVIDTDGTLAANSDQRLPSQKAVRTAINALIGANDVEVFKGTIDCSVNPNYPTADAGHVYRVSVAGKIGGASGVNVEINDRLQCTVDGTVSGNQATVGANWWITQANLDGAVIGPASATDGLPALFDGTSGKLLKNSTWAGVRNALLDSLSTVQGTILYRGSAGWVALAPGTLGYVLKAGGAGADVAWGASAGGGNVSSAGTPLDNAAVRFDGTSGTDVQPSPLVIADTTGALSRVGNGGIPVQGTNANDNAPSGFVGEVIESVIVAGSAVTLTASTPANMTSVNLTAGDWDVTFQPSYALDSTTQITTIVASISATSATSDATPGRLLLDRRANYTPLGDLVLQPLRARFSLSSTAPIYAVAQLAFTTSFAKAYGVLRARRVR